MQLERSDLEGWSDHVIARPIGPLPPPVLATGSVLRPPASPRAVAAAERRLGVALPASYRSFLLLSDGAYADWEQPMRGDRAWKRDRVETSVPGAGLLPAADVRRLVDVVPDVVDMWTIADFDVNPPAPTEKHNGGEWGSTRGLRDALLVSSLTSERGKFFLCLVPVEDRFDAGGERWELWDKFHSGFSRYLSFFDWLLWRRRPGRVLGPPGQVPGVEPTRRLLRENPGGRPEWRAGLLRGLAGGPTTPELVDYLFRQSDDPEEDAYVRLAAAQALQAHDPAIGTAQLVELRWVPEPSVQLAVEASLRLVGHPAPG